MTKLKCVIFLGSTRGPEELGPFPGRIGDRVSSFLVKQLGQEVEVRVIDPAEPNYLLPLLHTPYHWSKMMGEKPSPNMQRLNDDVAWADCYVFVTPEYNYSIAPGLSNLIAHVAPVKFGGKMARKPSLLVTYSMGLYGGARAGIQLLALASEIGTVVCGNQTNIIEAHQSLTPGGDEVPPKGWSQDQVPPITQGFQLAKKEFLFVAQALATARQAAEAQRKQKKQQAKL